MYLFGCRDSMGPNSFNPMEIPFNRGGCSSVMKYRIYKCDYTFEKNDMKNTRYGYIAFKCLKHCYSLTIQSQKRCIDEFNCISLGEQIF